MLLLRMATAVMIGGASLYALQRSAHLAVVIAPALASTSMLMGFCTRFTAIFCAICAIGAGIWLWDWRGGLVIVEALNLVAIGLLGGGAFSVDAYLFGRRVIRLDNESG